MTEWKEYKLGEIATFSYGKLPNKILLGKGPYVVYSGYKYLEHYPEYNCNVGDVILVARGVGGTGDVKLVNRKCFLTNLSIKIDLDNDVILNEYFYYIYQIENLRYLDSGSAQSQITIQDLSNVAISLPPLSEQIRIASILSSLDDKIDLLHRENKILETMAETLFRQWFIDEAKEDWKEVLITDLFEVKDGTHDSPKSQNFGYKLITSKYIHNNSIDFENAYSISENDYITINKRSKVETNDILFSMIGTIGLIYLEENTQINYAIKNIGLIKTSQNDVWKYFVYLWFKSEIGKDWIFENKTGSTQEYISLTSLRNIKFRIKSIEQINQFNQLIEYYFKKIKINKQQIQTLTQQRDGLLPKLMSGEVKI